MRLFDKLTGGGVDWQIELDSTVGAYRPGDTVVGRARYTPRGNMQVRSIRAALVATEHYLQVVQRTRSRSGSRGSTTESEREWFSDELFRQEVEPSGPTALVAQAAGEIAFQFTIPSNALPSFDSDVLRLRWQIRASMDVGGKDPASERDIYVTAGADRLVAPDAATALAPSVVDPSGQASLYVEPAPLVAGQQFRGYVETGEQLDLGSTRVELKQTVTTMGGSRGALGGATVSFNNFSMGLGGGGVSDERVLWAGQLSPMGPGPQGNRYQFLGQIPLAPVGTINLPHGSSSARIDVVISRRLMPDRHISRPVAIVTG